MIHEAMVLEYAGPDLALVELAAAMRLVLFGALLVNLFVPWGIATTTGSAAIAIGARRVGRQARRPRRRARRRSRCSPPRFDCSGCPSCSPCRSSSRSWRSPPPRSSADHDRRHVPSAARARGRCRPRRARCSRCGAEACARSCGSSPRKASRSPRSRAARRHLSPRGRATSRSRSCSSCSRSWSSRPCWCRVVRERPTSASPNRSSTCRRPLLGAAVLTVVAFAATRGLVGLHPSPEGDALPASASRSC